MCVHNPDFELNRALRSGLDEFDLLWAGIGLRQAAPEDEAVPF